jgi:hypothetical protein
MGEIQFNAVQSTQTCSPTEPELRRSDLEGSNSIRSAQTASATTIASSLAGNRHRPKSIILSIRW